MGALSLIFQLVVRLLRRLEAAGVLMDFDDEKDCGFLYLVAACAVLKFAKFNIYNCILRAKFALKIYSCKIFLRINADTTTRQRRSNSDEMRVYTRVRAPQVQFIILCRETCWEG